MRMVDLIEKKRDGGVLTDDEIRFIIRGFTDGSIPDYQMSAFAMTVFYKGMTDHETAVLTDAMMHSGDTVDLSRFGDKSVDKHSTGGVGDKTTLIVAPIVSSLGGKMAKMSGRGLGHTGGTVDKLESIPGYQTTLSADAFMRQVEQVGVAVIGQSGNLTPADKKLYALRDVTATIDSLPLITSSIMSKKLAAGADVIVLDVKCGGGAFMKTEEQAGELARNLTRIGNMAGRKTAAVITDMDQPLGCAVGNAVEVKEAISVLSGETQGDLLELCLTLGSCMLVSAGFAKNDDEARAELMETIRSGKALQKLADLVEAQGGDADAVYEPSMLPDAKVKLEVPSTEAGYVSHINAEEVGLVSMHLGGGRATKESTIDLSVGVVLAKKLGDHVEEGESLGTIHASSMEKAQEAAELLRGCYKFSTAPVERPAFIKGIVR